MRLPFTSYARSDLVILSVVCVAAAAGSAWLAAERPWMWALASLFAALWLLVLNFFRDPERHVPSGEFLVVSPADGVVKDIGDVEEPSFLGQPASRLGIFLSPLDVHVNRMPMDCRVARVEYRKGRMLRAFDPLAITENESCATFLEVLGGRGRMIVRQVTGAVARRIVCPVRPGDAFRAGERFGMIKFGSRTEVWVPHGLRVRWKVAVGDKVRGGSTVLGEVRPHATDVGDAGDAGWPDEPSRDSGGPASA